MSKRLIVYLKDVCLELFGWSFLFGAFLESGVATVASDAIAHFDVTVSLDAPVAVVVFLS